MSSCHVVPAPARAPERRSVYQIAESIAEEYRTVRKWHDMSAQDVLDMHRTLIAEMVREHGRACIGSGRVR